MRQGEHAQPAASLRKVCLQLQHYKEIKPADWASPVCVGRMALMPLAELGFLLILWAKGR
jgi:hypothetical protein